MSYSSSCPLLEVRELSTHFSIEGHSYPVVDRVNFEVHSGETLAIVGESGCGKSLTALSIMRLLPSPPATHSTGKLLYKGRNLLEISEREMRVIRGREIAMIFQDSSSALNPVYSIGEQLIEIAQWHLGLDEDQAYALSLQTLTEVGVSHPRQRMNDYPHQLSGGMRQRVAIALALICQPNLLIADEPTTALDVTIQAQVLALLKEVQKRHHMALILITHDWGVVAELADRVVVMYASNDVESAGVTEIFDKPSHPYTKALFQSLPTLEQKRGKLSSIPGHVPPLTDYPKGCRFHPRCPHRMEKCENGDVREFILESEQHHTAKCWLHEGAKSSK
ncbi:MAG: ABC transporter ATP-binding protein [Chlamydiia bacterium]|nr:ABC transporter ATP-binding protein [Chlamydiia bacterium]